jgi:HlyD family secretion protein
MEAPAKRRTRRVTYAQGLLAVALFGSGCRRDENDLVLVGTVERTLIELVAPVAETIESLAVERGARVKRDALVVQLDPTLPRADLARAEAAVAGARTTATVAADELGRSLTLHRQGVASTHDLDAARRASDEAAALLREAQAQLAGARHRLDELQLVAPAAGVVDQLPFDPGERVPAGAVVAVIVADGPPWVRVWLPARALPHVGLGTDVGVRVDGLDRPLAGRVVEIAREPAYTPHYALTERERVHLVYETRVEIADAPPSLRPGQPAEVLVALGNS